MGRVLAIDYGKKRVGLAWTDPLQLSINPLETIEESMLKKWVQNVIESEDMETIVLGYPKDALGKDTHVTKEVIGLKEFFEKKYPDLIIRLVDESYSSQDAMKYMVQQGWKQKDRRKKGNLDKISAAIILQRYMDGY